MLGRSPLRKAYFTFISSVTNCKRSNKNKNKKKKLQILTHFSTDDESRAHRRRLERVSSLTSFILSHTINLIVCFELEIERWFLRTVLWIEKKKEEKYRATELESSRIWIQMMSSNINLEDRGGSSQAILRLKYFLF